MKFKLLEEILICLECGGGIIDRMIPHPELQYHCSDGSVEQYPDDFYIMTCCFCNEVYMNQEEDIALDKAILERKRNKMMNT